MQRVLRAVYVLDLMQSDELNHIIDDVDAFSEIQEQLETIELSINVLGSYVEILTVNNNPVVKNKVVLTTNGIANITNWKTDEEKTTRKSVNKDSTKTD